VDVVATDNSYNRASGRTDCVGSTCTYSEEIQNFANWYSYYSTRMQMMKSATTIAFSPLDDKFRVGYDNICGADTGTETTVVRGVGQFVDGGEIANQRTNWWSNLVSTSPNCATPLRSTAAKIGRYYAGKLTGSADPMQYSCQQNFIMMVTDGYWNENETSAIKGVTGADIGNQDNVLANAPRPYFDGQQASTTCPAVGSGRGNNASSCRTLGDIAWYYYSTDLRSSAFGNATNAGGLDVATNNVLVSPDDPNTAQHMVFYAMGLGIDGILEYRSDYQTAGVGDFAEIRAGSRNWPAVANLAPTGVDDLWHATVNGHGKYFSARNVPNVVAGLKEALNKIGARVGSASASATSNLRPVTGDNFAYVANYTTVDWTGDLQSRTIDLTNAAVSEDGTHCGVDMANCQWSAQARIDQMTWSARRLFVKPLSNVSGDPLRPFTYTDLTATERNLLDPGVAPAISQYAALHVSNPGDINTSNLVDFLRGNRGLEQDGDVSHPQIWRKRVHVLGDIVNTSPIFVKSPDLKYVDAGYDQFKTTSAAASRKPVVFISAQDGMIHTINADTSPVTVASATVQPGEEMWSYIPQQSLAQMKTLADQNYTHRFFIDGPTVVSDANFGNGVSDWHTLMVAGLGAGGTSYVALDVTDPLAPVYLWEFTDSRLGSALGNPEIKKLPNGEWAVLFTSGYNNADGNGYLFAVDPATGSVKSGFPLATGSGTAGSPSNLGKLTVWMNNPNQDATAQYVYAGDTKGGVWRFDLNPSAAGHTGVAVYKLAHLTHSGVDQPITTRIEVTEQCGTPKIRLVYVSTGQYLATADLTNTDVQAFYAIKDRLVSTASPPAAERNLDSSTAGGTTPTFEKRVLHSVYSDGTPITTTVNGATKSGRIVCRAGASVSRLAGACVDDSAAKLDWTTSPGFFFNFPESGERTSIDPELIEGTVVINSNIPGASSCTIGGVSRNTQVSACAGLDPGPEPEPIPPCTGPGCTNDGGVLIDPTRHDNPAKINANLDCIVVGNALVQLPDGSWWNIQTCSDGTHRNVAKDVQPRSVFDSKRSLWREYEPF
jgi:type IV pilus assembly protein PilY1